MPQYTLMAHQQAGVEFLESVDGIGALLWDPGVGKTGATLSWIDQQAAKPEHKDGFRVLVVSPLAASDTWVLQAPPFMDSTVKARFLQGRTVDIIAKIRVAATWRSVPESDIKVDHKGSGRKARNKVTILSVSAGAVSSWCTNRKQTVQMLQAVRRYQPHLVIVDESHIIKSADANISKALYQIGQLAPHRIILTGTVNPKDALDCYGQWRFVAPWTFSDSHGDPMTENPLTMTRSQVASIRPWPWKRFQDRYAEMVVRRNVPVKVMNGVNQETVPELHARVAERSMVVSKEDALDLPPTTDVDVHVTLNAAERAAYMQMHDELAAQLASGELIEAPNTLAKLMKLRQIAAGFVKNTETGEVHVVGHSLQKTVCEIVNVNLRDENRIVVFAYFKAEVAALASSLAKSGRIVETVTGATKANERLAIRKRFLDVSGNPTPTVLVAQARTMSVSVNELVTASHAVYASLSERREDLVQSRGRLDRPGQTRPVTYWNCYVPGSVQEVMIRTHARRGDMEKAMLDHIRTTPRLNVA